MESIFTYDPNRPRLSSPWSTAGDTSRLLPERGGSSSVRRSSVASAVSGPILPIHLSETGLTRLEAEPQEGPIEYKLHILLRPRRAFLSISTSNQLPRSQFRKPNLLKAGVRLTNVASAGSHHVPSTLYRQSRLQQLTTQLLWRLQQSSPFHSCSANGLVLPSLPDATPKLGRPTKPARLLPGLEQSQGALYEIGVSDDGTFVGLVEDELEESLNNLEAMAASLGCVVEVLRKVLVGHCKWRETDPVGDTKHTTTKAQVGNLWVAEALVLPSPSAIFQTQMSPAVVPPAGTLRSRHESEVSSLGLLSKSTGAQAEQLRISIVGSTNSGKSSLLGTLTTSTLDDGRGKSRINLLKHRHEIASGITSSVSQELLGYRTKSASTGTTTQSDRPEFTDVEILNYATENVSSWNDIHSAAARLTILFDSPGMSRYSKSTIRSLMSWNPHWALVCVAADSESGLSDPDLISKPDASLLHLELALKLELPIIVAVTKMDIATRQGLRLTLSKILSALKAAARVPAMTSTSGSSSPAQDMARFLPEIIPSADDNAVKPIRKVIAGKGRQTVPIILTSAMTGQGVNALHALMESIPLFDDPNLPHPIGDSLVQNRQWRSGIFHIDEVFATPPPKPFPISQDMYSQGVQGIILCGFVASGSIRIGDFMRMGPFGVPRDNTDPNYLMPVNLSLSFPESPRPATSDLDGYAKSTSSVDVSANVSSLEASAKVIWQVVKVVSLRNLRMPTSCLEAGQVGTIGVESVEQQSSCHHDLRLARRGMVLLSRSGPQPQASRSFSVLFLASDFHAPDSPPLILGGHATAYVNSIRATVTVTCLSLVNGDNVIDSIHDDEDDADIFAFENGQRQRSDREERWVRIRFTFLRGVEWAALNDRVLVVPNSGIASPATVSSGHATAVSYDAAHGVRGFMGWICEVDG